jgi:hypothetical protein
MENDTAGIRFETCDTKMVAMVAVTRRTWGPTRPNSLAIVPLWLRRAIVTTQAKWWENRKAILRSIANLFKIGVKVGDSYRDQLGCAWPTFIPMTNSVFSCLPSIFSRS